MGSDGDNEKVQFLLEELGFDAAFNHKEESAKHALSKLCPDGPRCLLILDVYWDNVGGETLDAALANCNAFARIVASEMIMKSNESEPYGVKNFMTIVSKRIRIEGFIQANLRHLYWQVQSIIFMVDLRISWMKWGDFIARGN